MTIENNLRKVAELEQTLLQTTKKCSDYENQATQALNKSIEFLSLKQELFSAEKSIAEQDSEIAVFKENCAAREAQLSELI